MSRAKGIVAYGTDLDREKLAVLAMVRNRSGSQILLDLLHAAYSDIFGDTPPEATGLLRKKEYRR